jgi:hypothetical protein
MKTIGTKLGAFVVSLAVLASAAGIAGAQAPADSTTGSTAPTTSATTLDTRPMRGFGFGHGQELTIVAEQLGITTDELFTALQGGKTVADLAAEKGIEVSTLIDAVIAAETETLTTAVTDGTLTQAQADAHLALLKANLEVGFSKVWTADAFGPNGQNGFDGRSGRGEHGGRGGHGGMGGQWNAPATDPAATPEATVVPNS